MPKSWQRCVDQAIDLLEGAGVEEQVEALARGELALLVLTLDLVLATAEPVGGQPSLQSLEHFPAHRVASPAVSALTSPAIP